MMITIDTMTKVMMMTSKVFLCLPLLSPNCQTAIQAWETLDLNVSHISLMLHPLSTSNVTYQFDLTFPFSTEDEYVAPPPYKNIDFKVSSACNETDKKTLHFKHVKTGVTNARYCIIGENMGTRCQSKVIQFGQNC